jgi:hypothetical protein
MKPFDYYSKPQTVYPNKKDYITFYVYDDGKVISKSCYGAYVDYVKPSLKTNYPNAVIQEVLDEEGYRAHQKQYGEEKHKLLQEFINDLFENFNVADNPKRHKAFDLAWAKGYSNGLEEVYNEFYDLVDLIKD